MSAMERVSDGIGEFTSLAGAVASITAEKDLANMDGDDCMCQVASMPYRYCRVSIFKKANRFFYEPLVLLEEDVSLPQHPSPDGRVEVTFKIQLWDYDLERRVITFLRNEVGEVGLKPHQVQMMPYEEVRLVAKKTTLPLRIPSGAVCLLQLPVLVDFEVIFSSEEEAELNANAKYLAKHFELHFTGPSSKGSQGTAKKVRRDSAFCVHRHSVFPINIVSRSICACEDDKAIAKHFTFEDVPIVHSLDAEHFKDILNSVCVPVFGASKLLEISDVGRVKFAKLTQPKGDVHGTFDMTTGVFTVKSSGLYLFQFNGVSYLNCITNVQLKVNGITKAGSQSYCADSCSTQDSSVDVSCVLFVRSEDEVAIFLENGDLHEAWPNATRFWGILLAGDN